MRKLRLWHGALLLSALVLLARWGAPLASPHAFRETQTAISVYWMLHGGPWLNYWTPVFGSPWRCPLELPLFQWLSAMVSALLPIDSAGRFVSWAFFIAVLWPLRRIASAWKLDANLVSVLWLCSPLMLYWGTCFLIDTCAIFFGAMYLWLILDGKKFSALICGTLSALVKGTAFVPFALASLSPMGLFPLLAGLGWQKWTDYLKPIGSLAGVINSTQPSQRLHNYGVLSDRLYIPSVIYDRIGMMLGGAALVLILIGVLSAILVRHRGLKERWPLLLAFFAPFFIFPRLYAAHEYYAMSQVPFAVLIVAAVIDLIPGVASRACAVILVGGELLTFALVYAPQLRDRQPMVAPAQYLRAHTKPTDVLLIYGQEWNSILPYYAERKAIMEPASLDSCEDQIRRAPTFHPNVVIRCPSPCDGNPDYERIFRPWGLTRSDVAHCATAFVD